MHNLPHPVFLFMILSAEMYILLRIDHLQYNISIFTQNNLESISFDTTLSCTKTEFSGNLCILMHIYNTNILASFLHIHGPATICVYVITYHKPTRFRFHVNIFYSVNSKNKYSLKT